MGRSLFGAPKDGRNRAGSAERRIVYRLRFSGSFSKSRVSSFMDMLGQLTWPQWFISVLVIFVCVLLTIVILIQRGRGGGLAGAFGGGGGTAAFGAKTGDVFTWITVGFATVFVLLAVVANFALDETPKKRPPGAPLTTTEESALGEEAPGAPVEPIKVEGQPFKVEGGTIDLPITVTPVKTDGEAQRPAGTPPTTTGTAPSGQPAQPGASGSTPPAPSSEKEKEPKKPDNDEKGQPGKSETP